MSDRNLFDSEIELRIFWEGVLFPYVESITIQDSPQSTTCTIQIPESHKLRPSELVGTMLHIFYSNSRIQENNPKDSGPSNWPILFQGELASESSQRTVQSHRKSLRFISHTRHFKQTNFYFFNPKRANADTAARNDTLTAFMGATEIDVNVNQVGAKKRTSIWDSFREAMETLDTSEGRNIAYQAVILEILREAKNNYPYLNYIDNKLKLSQRFAAYEDPDVRHIIDLQAMSKVLENRAQAMSENTSLMEILNVANRMLKYNWNHLSQPQLRRIGEELVEASEGDTEGSTKQKARVATVNIKEAILDNRSSAATPWGRVQIPSNLQGRKTSVDEFTNELYEAIESGQDEVQAAQNLLEEIVPKTGDSLPSSLSYAKDWAEEKVTNLLDSFNIDQSRLKNGDFINEFTVTPNMEFSHPPKCNVILPHNITSMGMNRNYFQEPTRLLGRMAFMEENPYTNWYIAPFEQSYYKLSGDNLEKFGPAYEEYTKEFTDDIHLASLEEEDEEG